VVGDSTILAPAAVGAARGVAHDLRWTSRDRQLLELALGDEGHEAAVWGPERAKGYALRAGEGMSLDRVERADPYLAHAGDVGGGESEVAPVGREHRRADHRQALGGRDLEAHQRG